MTQVSSRPSSRASLCQLRHLPQRRSWPPRKSWPLRRSRPSGRLRSWRWARHGRTTKSTTVGAPPFSFMSGAWRWCSRAVVLLTRIGGILKS
jgi:hypothetical protein